jgi:hypothetical protein
MRLSRRDTVSFFLDRALAEMKQCEVILGDVRTTGPRLHELERVYAGMLRVIAHLSVCRGTYLGG